MRRKALLVTAAIWVLAAIVVISGGLARAAPTSALATVEIAVALTAGFVLLERFAIPFAWRGQRIATALTEPLVFLALALGFGPVLVPVLVVARLVTAILQARPPLKTAFNLGQIALAASVAAVVARAAGDAGALVAAGVGTLAYVTTTESTLALLFSVLERTPPREAIKARLGAKFLFQSLVGLSMGVALYALDALHPLLLVVTLPILWLAHRAGSLQSRAERENALHRGLASRWQSIAGCTDDAQIARVVLDTCRETLPIGQAEVALASGSSWVRTWDAVAGEPELRVPLHLNGSPIGSLAVWRRPGRNALPEDDRILLLAIASQASSAFGGASAFREVIAQRLLLSRQERLSVIGSLAAGVAHEVNNPLTYLKGNIELAMLEIEELEATTDRRDRLQETRQLLSVSVRGADRIRHIVHALRSIARQRPEGHREAVKLNELARETATLLAAALPENVTVEIEPHDSEPIVLGHSPDLHQVVLNLAKNAVEATAERGGTVVLRVKREGDAYAAIEIEDEGSGVHPNIEQQLFTPFFTTKPEGTGLGLSIAQGIVRDHGGDLTFRNRPERGAVFTVQFPCVRLARESLMATPSHDLAGRSGLARSADRGS